MNTKPKYWPRNELWPLKNGVYIEAEIETYPPIYVLSDKTEIQGVLTASEKLKFAKSIIKNKRSNN
jgi:hypothetical protein